MAGKRILIVGGVAAGPKAAARARRLDPDASITILQRSNDLSMASCGYPYYIGGAFDEREKLLSTPVGTVRTPAFFEKAKGVEARVGTEVTAIDPDGHTVTVQAVEGGAEETLAYDKLILATGAEPVTPPIPGVELDGISTLWSLEDTDYLRGVCDNGTARRAVVVGGGLVGMEMCEAFLRRGLETTVVEMLPHVLNFLDEELARLVEKHARAKGAAILTGRRVTEFVGEGGRLTAVKLEDGTEIPAEVAVLSTGVKPRTELAARAGLEVGAEGLVVNEYMQTSHPDIYAAGDCCEIPHLVSGKAVHVPFGDLANLEGRVAGQNAVLGNSATFPGTLMTGICKIFDYTAGSTGLAEGAAREAEFTDISTALIAIPERPTYLGAKPVILKLVADNRTGRLLGMQGVGPGDVSRRVAAAATALHGKLTVAQLVNADLPYAPPYSNALDALITAAHALENKMQGRMTGISSTELKRRLDAGETPFLLDVRTEQEYDDFRLGRGETLIPLGALRQRVRELPQEKDAEIIAYCKVSLRGYEAATVLRQQGYSNVKVLEGGLIAWPYELAG